MDNANKSWKQHNFFSVVAESYDRLFVVRGNLEAITDVLENIDDDASYTKLKNAFIKSSSTAKGSRVIASQIVDIIAA